METPAVPHPRIFPSRLYNIPKPALLHVPYHPAIHQGYYPPAHEVYKLCRMGGLLKMALASSTRLHWEMDISKG